MNSKLKYIFPAIAALTLIAGGVLFILPEEERFGAGTSTYTIGGNLVVGGTATITGAITAVSQTIATLTGYSSTLGALNVTSTLITPSLSASTTVGGVFSATTLALSGTSTFSGEVLGVPRALSIAMTSATNTACAIQNTSGNTRQVLAAGVIMTSTTSAGTVDFAFGTSTGMTVTSTSPLWAGVITRVAGADIANATSTLIGSSGVYTTWANGDWITGNSGVTSTHAGYCKVLFY